MYTYPITGQNIITAKSSRSAGATNGNVATTGARIDVKTAVTIAVATETGIVIETVVIKRLPGV